MKILYLGISGVLHPSASTYKFIHGRSPWKEGHSRYEGVPVLESLLDRWPEVQIILTSTQPWAKGLPFVLAQLGPKLAARVRGFTFEDLTTQVKRGRRQSPFSDDAYWRMDKSQVVRFHVDWLNPAAWVAVDDEDILWTDQERAEHLVLVDGCKGLMDPDAQQRLLAAFERNFGVGLK